jgi:hypothetical protein
MSLLDKPWSGGRNFFTILNLYWKSLIYYLFPFAPAIPARALRNLTFLSHIAFQASLTTSHYGRTPVDIIVILFLKADKVNEVSLTIIVSKRRPILTVLSFNYQGRGPYCWTDCQCVESRARCTSLLFCESREIKWDIGGWKAFTPKRSLCGDYWLRVLSFYIRVGELPLEAAWRTTG